MTWETVVDVLLDALKDSGLVLAFVFIFHVLLSFIEDKLSNFLTKSCSNIWIDLWNYSSMWDKRSCCGFIYRQIHHDWNINRCLFKL